MKDPIPDRLLDQGPFIKWEFVVRESFDLKELYKRIHEYFVDEEFADLTIGNINFETFYREKDNGDGTKDHKIWWRMARYAKNDANKNIKFYVQLDWKTVRMTQTEVIRDGKKIKLDNGELEFKFSLFLDFENSQEDRQAFNNHWLLKYFKNLFWHKWNRVPTDLAKGEAAAFSNEFYSLLQTQTGVRRADSNQRRDHVLGQSFQ